MAFNRARQGTSMFPSSGVSTQVQFGPRAATQVPGPQIPPNGAHPSPSQSQTTTVTNHGIMKPGSDFYLKVLCPENKKEYKTVSLRGLSPETLIHLPN